MGYEMNAVTTYRVSYIGRLVKACGVPRREPSLPYNSAFSSEARYRTVHTRVCCGLCHGVSGGVCSTHAITDTVSSLIPLNIREPLSRLSHHGKRYLRS